MAKIEVLAELLTEELDEFKKNVSKLETLIDSIKNVKLKPDVSQLEIMNTKYIQSQKSLFNSSLKSLEKFSDKLNVGNTYPKWLLGLFSGVLILFIGLIFYLIMSIQSQHQVSYQKGKEIAIEHFQSFIKSEIAITKKYQTWNNKNVKK